MSQGSDVKFVNPDLDSTLDIRLLRVDIDYLMTEKYRFFVPKIGNTVCQDKAEMCSHFHMVNYDVSKKCWNCCGANVQATTQSFYAVFLKPEFQIVAEFLIKQSIAGYCRI